MSSRPPWLAALAFVASAAACQPSPEVRPQWKVTLRTDAPVPLVADRALVEVTTASGALACTDCRRILDASTKDAWPITFGVVPGDGTLFVRVRLTRASTTTSSGAPDPSNTIDALVLLRGAAGPVSVALGMECFGVPSTGDQSCDPRTGVLAAVGDAAPGEGDALLVPGSWPLATTVGCDGAAPDGMLCVPGGLYFMRDVDPNFVGIERLVRISSYFADIDEMSVGRARALIVANDLSEPLTPAAKATCTYLGRDRAANDAQSLNCVPLALARSLCAAEGKRLPTDAELGYVLTNGAEGTAYPWGNDDDICAHAVVARDTIGECLSGPGRASFDPGPIPAGAPTNDVSTSPAGLRNLGGNMAEWVVDTYDDLTGPCWTGIHPLLDNPVCRGPGAPTIRGGAWPDDRFAASAGFRSSVGPNGLDSVGIRCVRDAHP